MPSKVKVVLRDYKTGQTIDYTIVSHEHELADKWIVALKELLSNGNLKRITAGMVGQIAHVH